MFLLAYAAVRCTAYSTTFDTANDNWTVATYCSHCSGHGGDECTQFSTNAVKYKLTIKGRDVRSAPRASNHASDRAAEPVVSPAAGPRCSLTPRPRPVSGAGRPSLSRVARGPRRGKTRREPATAAVGVATSVSTERPRL